ncbi:hypothetical protein L3X38_006899 [Prunus dulcis]|uniref:Uncharacterized protein n=1 Tax=Prunus dulcis TaxID=3755 RepID=A0AAD5F5N7_PRUDU|nr:hypothetical protein L3X38_006899 [Prunus dulcis]
MPQASHAKLENLSISVESQSRCRFGAHSVRSSSGSEVLDCLLILYCKPVGFGLDLVEALKRRRFGLNQVGVFSFGSS